MQREVLGRRQTAVLVGKNVNQPAWGTGEGHRKVGNSKYHTMILGDCNLNVSDILNEDDPSSPRNGLQRRGQEEPKLMMMKKA